MTSTEMKCDLSPFFKWGEKLSNKLELDIFLKLPPITLLKTWKKVESKRD
jgi:hypothetical protein